MSRLESATTVGGAVVPSSKNNNSNNFKKEKRSQESPTCIPVLKPFGFSRCKSQVTIVTWCSNNLVPTEKDPPQCLCKYPVYQHKKKTL